MTWLFAVVTTACGGGGGGGSGGTLTVTSLEISPSSETLAAGLSRQFTLVGHYSDGSSRDVTLEAQWSSSVPAVASIESGSVNGGRAVAMSIGDTVVRGEFSTLQAEANLQVTPPVATQVVVSPDSARLPLLVQSPLFATAIFTDSSVQDVTALCSWVSSDLAVLEVGTSGSEAGVVRSLTSGTANVTATFQGLVSVAALEVVPVDALEIGVPASSALTTPLVAFGPAGQLDAAWCYQFADPSKLYLSHFDPASAWTSPEIYDTSSLADRVWKTLIVSNDAGASLLAWDGHDGLYAAYREPSGSFSAPTVIASGAHPFLDFAPSLFLEIDSSGRGLIVWKSAAFQTIQSARFDPLSGWGPPTTVVADAPLIQLSSTQFEMNEDGVGFLFWLEGSVVSGWQLLAARFDPVAGWQTEQPFADLEVPPTFHLSINSSGSAIVTWHDFFPTPLIFASRYEPSLGWLPPDQIADSNGARDPRVALASNGDAFVEWRNASNQDFEGNRYVAGSGWQGVETLREVSLPEGDPTILTPFMNEAGDIVAFWATGQVPPKVQYRHRHPVLGWQPLESIDFLGLTGPEASKLVLRTHDDGRTVLTWQEPGLGDVDHAFAYRFQVP